MYGTHRLYRIDDQQRLQAVQVSRLGSISNADQTLFLVRSKELAPGDLIVNTQLANAVEGLKVKPADNE